MKILLIEDEDSIRKAIQTFLVANNYDVMCYSNGSDGYNAIYRNEFDLILSDNMMPGKTGLQILNQLKEDKSNIPFILMTAYANVEDAVSAIKIGAEDYLTKPLNLDELLIKINRVVKQNELVVENKSLKQKLSRYELPKLIGDSSEIKKLKELIVRIAEDKDVSVMIYGESGTGKELVAEYIHSKSERKKYPFIPINCAALPNDLLESELFGHVKGAFTGALQDKIGLIKAAHKGTLFLDEVSEMSPGLQSKLLRVLQDRKVQPIGSIEFINVDIRVVGASNVRLEKLIEENKFREDLFYRLNVVELTVPPLRERFGDIPILIEHIIAKYKNGREKLVITPDALSLLQKYSFPGNVRELENIIRGLFVTLDSSTVRPENLPKKVLSESSCDSDTQSFTSGYQYELQKVVEKFEKGFLLYHIKKNNGNISKTAEDIGLSRVSLHKKVKMYNINENI